VNTVPPDARTLSKRASQVVLAAVLMTAVSGYFMGLTQMTATRAEARGAPLPGLPGAPGPADGDGGSAVPSIVEYRRLGESDLKPNAHWVSRLGSLRTSIPAAPGGGAAASATSLPASEAERTRAVEIRAGRRAFDGAPPVIPHPVDPVSPANCRACHLTGLAVRGLVAPKMSHGEMGSCNQCHVPAGGPGLVAAGELARLGEDNDFAGLRSAGRGSRAWPGAPPTIPHLLWMRQDCSSCHGPAGLAGLRTSHPERALCQQCHVPDGVADVPPWLRPELAGSARPDAFNAAP
jgi:cytochrome c-type protein NapB